MRCSPVCRYFRVFVFLAFFILLPPFRPAAQEPDGGGFAAPAGGETSSPEAAPETGPENAGGQTRGRNIALGLVESQFTNALLHVVNRAAGNDFASVTAGSIRNNFTRPWQWDQSLFRTNQLGHPYQGVFYHQAGRANNWTFYESAGNAALGSAVWEVFCERSRASLNDLIITTTGGAVMGEALHRLYYAAENLPGAVRFFLSPFDFFNPVLPGNRTNRPRGELYTLDAVFALSAGMSGRSGPESSRVGGNFSFGGSAVLRLVYGNPFTAYVPLSDPFRHFEMTVMADIGWPVYQLSVFTGGSLYAYPFAAGNNTEGTLGLSLRYDVVLGDTVSFSGTSLDFAFHSRTATRAGNLDWKLHAGWLVLGAANTYYPLPDFSGWDKKEFQLYGTGANLKLSAGITGTAAGDFRLDAALYFMPLIEAGYSGWGDTLFFFQGGFGYDFPLTEHVILSFSTTHSFSLERFRARRDISEYASVFRLGAGYRFQAE